MKILTISVLLSFSVIVWAGETRQALSATGYGATESEALSQAHSQVELQASAFVHNCEYNLGGFSSISIDGSSCQDMGNGNGMNRYRCQEWGAAICTTPNVSTTLLSLFSRPNRSEEEAPRCGRRIYIMNSCEPSESACASECRSAGACDYSVRYVSRGACDGYPEDYQYICTCYGWY